MTLVRAQCVFSTSSTGGLLRNFRTCVDSPGNGVHCKALRTNDFWPTPVPRLGLLGTELGKLLRNS